MISHSIPSRLTGRPRKGFTLIEAMTVVTMMAIISAMAVPSFRLAMEESKADIAQANLRAIWAAERFYWMSNRQYTEDINTLVSLGLLDPDSMAEHLTGASESLPVFGVSAVGF